MYIIADRMRAVYNRVFSVDTLSKIMATVTPLLIVKEHIVYYFRSLVPSYIERIIHFDIKKGSTDVVYVGWKNMYSMKRATYNLLGLSREGYYMFVIWNKLHRKYEHIFLRGELVEKALEIKNIYNIWALHEEAIVLLLSNYVQYASIYKDTILGLTLNRKDITKKIKPFTRSLNIPDNACPSALYMLLTYLEDDVVHILTMKTSMCTYINYDMEEIPIPYGDKYIICSNSASNSIIPCTPTIYQDAEQEKKENKLVSVPTDVEEDLSEVEELHEQPCLIQASEQKESIIGSPASTPASTPYNPSIAAPASTPNVTAPAPLSPSSPPSPPSLSPTKSYHSLVKKACANIISPRGDVGRLDGYVKNKAV
jgi:hypothetical protein